MTLSVSLSRWVQFTCLTLFLAASLTPPADAGSRRKRDSSAQGNSAPVISGVPAETVAQGSSYVFQPTASDPDGDRLSFRIRNLPAWASFNSSTGRLSGTPGAGDAGSYSNIRIRVSDGTAITSLPAFDISVGSATGGGSVSLSWLAPTSRSDGTPIAPSELSGYTVHYGSASGSYTNLIAIDDPFTTSVTVTDLPVGTYYFALTAEDSNGQKSNYSGVVTRQVR
jgi:hypothetical protein